MDGHRLYEQLVAHLPSGVIAFRLEGPGGVENLRVVHLNAEARRLLAIDDGEEIVGARLGERWPELADDPNYQKLPPVAETGASADLGDVRDATDPQRIFAARAFALPDRGVGVLFEDVTPRREMARLFERQGVRFRAIVETTNQFIGLLQPDGRVIEANKTSLEFAGIREEDVIDRPLWECYWWSYDEGVQEQLRDAVRRAAGGEFVRYQAQIRGAGTSRAVIDFSLRPIIEEGEVVMLLPEGYVITDLVRAQQALARLQQRTERILNAAGEGVVGIGPAGNILFANEAAAFLLGVPADDLSGRPFENVLRVADQADDGDDNVETVIRDVLDQQTTARTGHTLFPRNGGESLFPVDYIVTAVKEESEMGAVVVFRDVSERIDSEQALRDSEKRHRNVVEALHEGVLLQDIDGNIVTANPAAERILDLSLDRLVDPNRVQQRWGFVDEDMNPLPDESRPSKVALRTGRPVEQFVMGLMGDDDELRWLLVSASPISQPDGEAEAVVTAFTEITEQRKSENRIRESELRHRTVLTTLNEGVMMVAQNGDVLAANPAARRILSLNLSEGANLFAETGRRVIDEFGRPMSVTDLPEYLAVTTGEVQRGKIKGIVRPDNSVRWVHVNAQPIPSIDHDADSRAVVVSVTDITEQREATLALQESEMRLQNAQHIAKLGHWRWDPVDGTTSWSEQMYVIYGQDPEQFTPDLDVYLEMLEPGARSTISDAIEAKSPYEVFHQVRRADGSQRFVRGRGEPVLDAAGQVISLQGTCQDITDLHEAQEALRRYARELEERNTELEQFAYVASHDLQEPLRMVSSFMQLLERRYADQLDETAVEYISFAVDGAKRMQRLIQDLLAYSRVGTRGKAFQRVDMAEIVNEVVLDLRSAIDDAGALVRVDGELPVIEADPTQMRQLMQNLIGNALKFRGEAPATIDITVEQVIDRGRPFWQIGVRDNGIGISEEHAERIFQIFQRLHTREEFEGTGIGLAICRKIVERHDGRLWMEPNPSGGSIFKFMLPTHRQTHHEDPAQGHT